MIVKEREIEIGYPMDVKHVSHIGLDSTSPSGSNPSWVCFFSLQNLFKFGVLFILVV